MNKIYENIFIYGTNISYVLYIIVLFGVSSFVPKYLNWLKTFLKIYIALILIILYNPITYRKKNFSDFDRKIAFSAGIFLLLTSTIISGIEEYLRQKGKYIINYALF